jgi:hypothetical protein
MIDAPTPVGLRSRVVLAVMISLLGIRSSSSL